MTFKTEDWGQWINNNGKDFPPIGSIAWAVYEKDLPQDLPSTANIYEVGKNYIIALVTGPFKGSWRKELGYNPILMFRIYKSRGYKLVEDALEPDHEILENFKHLELQV